MPARRADFFPRWGFPRLVIALKDTTSGARGCDSATRTVSSSLQSSTTQTRTVIGPRDAFKSSNSVPMRWASFRTGTTTSKAAACVLLSLFGSLGTKLDLFHPRRQRSKVNTWPRKAAIMSPRRTSERSSIGHALERPNPHQCGKATVQCPDHKGAGHHSGDLAVEHPCGSSFSHAQFSRPWEGRHHTPNPCDARKSF